MSPHQRRNPSSSEVSGKSPNDFNGARIHKPPQGNFIFFRLELSTVFTFIRHRHRDEVTVLSKKVCIVS